MTDGSGAAGNFRYIDYRLEAEGTIARVILNRPDRRNAQNRGLLVELSDAFERAEADDDVRVVILSGAGKIFSAGHDLGSAEARAEVLGPDVHPSYQGYGATRKGAEARTLQEWHFFFENTRRWRNLRKITIAQVKGPVFAGGLMLAWCCDLIVASSDTVFAEVVGTRLGMCGGEYFGYPWEFGPRRAKELLLTGDAIDAIEAHRLGMVSKVFPPEDLERLTVEYAQRIANMPSATALFIKESVNQTVDNMGFYNSLNACFTLHQLNHAHWAEVHAGGYPAAQPEDGVPPWNEAPQPQLVSYDTAGG